MNLTPIRKVAYLALLLILILILPAICSSQIWNSQATNPIGSIDDGVGFSIGDKGFVGTGRDAGFQYRNDFYKFENNSWQQIASINGLPRQYATSFSFENTGCIVTGYSSQATVLDELQCYSESTDIWTTKSPLPASGRLQAASFTIGSKGYCGGGRNTQGDLKDWYVYNLNSDTWVAIADFPNSRNECVAFSINGQGYVGLGRDNQGNFYNDFYRYNPLNDSWTEIANFPGNIRTYSIATVLNNKSYVYTGLDELDQLSNEVWSYNPINNIWIQQNDFPFDNVKGTSGFSIADCMYISTGIDVNSTRLDFCYAYCEGYREENEYSLYPNPSNGETVLTAIDNSDIGTIEIYNSQGALILSLIVNSYFSSIDLSNLSVGLYLVKISNEQGNPTILKLTKI